MSNIERLYYNMDKLIDNYADTEEVKRTLDRLETVFGRELYAKYEDEISDYVSASEKQGFITGFQYAVSLMSSEKGGVVVLGK